MSVHISAVGKAFGVLSDPEKKRKYDLYGSDSDRAASSSHSHRHSHGGFHTNGHYYYYDDGKTYVLFLSCLLRRQIVKMALYL